VILDILGTQPQMTLEEFLADRATLEQVWREQHDPPRVS
jgi:hypothetical protein